MADLHEVHTCKDCGAVITLPYAKPVHTHGPHTGPGIECPELVVSNCRVAAPEDTRTADPGGLCVERGGTEPCTHHAGSGPVHPGPALTGAKPLPALTPEATAPDDDIPRSQHWQRRDAIDGGHSDR